MTKTCKGYDKVIFIFVIGRMWCSLSYDVTLATSFIAEACYASRTHHLVILGWASFSFATLPQ